MAEPLIEKEEGFLVIDDTVLDHWYGKKIGLAKWQYSGTHHRVVYPSYSGLQPERAKKLIRWVYTESNLSYRSIHGIGLTTLLWTNRLPAKYAEHIPIDYRIYAPMQEYS